MGIYSDLMHQIDITGAKDIERFMTISNMAINFKNEGKLTPEEALKIMSICNGHIFNIDGVKIIK